MKHYEFIEIVVKENFKREFTLTDIKNFVRVNRSIEIDHTYLSKLLKQLLEKKIVELIRIENKERGLFAKKYYRLVDKRKWEDIFK